MCRHNGKDLIKAAQWYYDHLNGQVPMVIIQSSSRDPTTDKEADRPKLLGKSMEDSSSRADDDDNELLEIMLNLGIHSPKRTDARPDPTAPSAANDGVNASRHGVKHCLCHFKSY